MNRRNASRFDVFRREREDFPRGGENRRKRRAAGAALLCLVLACLPGASAAAKKIPPSAPLDLNSASAEQLEQVPGIGPGTAKAIVQFRMKSGPLRRVEDLLAIRGVTQRKLAALRPYVTIAPPHPGA